MQNQSGHFSQDNHSFLNEDSLKEQPDFEHVLSSIFFWVDNWEVVAFKFVFLLAGGFVFLFAAYLKAAKNVTIDAIYYGALELGNSETGIPAPVIDLSEFVSMIDWLTATDQFIKTGNGKSLANLLLNGNTELQELASGIDGISR